jgi:hypothetical protein
MAAKFGIAMWKVQGVTILDASTIIAVTIMLATLPQPVLVLSLPG